MTRTEITRATGLSHDGITGEIISQGTPVAHVVFNTRCAPFFTAQSLRQLADKIEPTSLTRDEIVTVIDAIDMWRDMCVDTKNDLQGQEKAEQAEYIDELQGIINKLQNTLL